MAPRTAKAKKAAEAKVAENEAPKKGRGKAKNIEEVAKDIDDLPLQFEDVEQEGAKVENGDLQEKASVEKKKRGQQNGDKEVVGQPAKRGRKKNMEPSVESANVEAPSEETVSNGGLSTASKEDKADPQAEEDDEGMDTDDVEEMPELKTYAASKKRPAKKEKEEKPKENGDAGDKVEEKPKGKGRGRKAQPKPEAQLEPEEEPEEVEEEAKTEAAKPKKGRGRAAKDKAPRNAEKADAKTENVVEEKPEKAKKGRGRAAKEKTPESENIDSSEENNFEEKPEDNPKPQKGRGRARVMTPDSTVDDRSEENNVEENVEKPEVKKAPAKGRKGKKAPAKEEENEDGKEDDEVKEPASKKRKADKKTEKGEAGDAAEDVEGEAPEVKPTKGKRGQRKVAEAPEPEAEPEDTGEASKRRRKPAEDKAPATKTKAAPKNKATTAYDEIDFSNTSTNPQGKPWNFKIASWNVDGIRAWMGKGGLDYLQHEKPDILCLQEVKCSQDKLPEECKNVPGYHAYWLCSEKDGYAGVGIYTTKLAMNVQYGLQDEELDSEGRIITAEYEQFYLVSTYVPNAGRKLVTLPKRLDWNEAFRNHVKELDKKKPVIICGDMNVAHNEIDLTHPKPNRKNAGFTDQERAGMTALLGDGFVDTYRHLRPDQTGAYTFWTYMGGSRAKNVGWRLDYFIVSERLVPTVCDHAIRDQVFGSDHCPIALFLHLTTADKPKEE